MMGTDAFVSCGKTCEHAVAFDGMFASRSPGRAETCEQTLRARRRKTPGARRSVCKSSLSRLSRNNPFSQARRGLKRIVPIIPPVWRAAILAAGGRRWNGGPTMHCAVRTHGALATVDLRHGSQKSNFFDANAESRVKETVPCRAEGEECRP